MREMTFWLSTAMCFLLVGCTSTQTTKIKYTNQKESPLRSFKPMTVVIRVEDRRPSEEKGYVSRAAMVGAKIIYVSKEGPADILLKALKQEFEGNGHTVGEARKGAPVVILSVALTRFMGALTGVDKMAQITADVTAQKAESTETSPFPVSGTFKKHYGGFNVLTADPQEEFDLALQDFIRNLALDPRFVKAFQ